MRATIRPRPCPPLDRKPTWWVLYVIAMAFGAMVGAIEVSVPEGGLRKLLEVAAVLVVFPLMAVWVRCNRLALDRERGRRR